MESVGQNSLAVAFLYFDAGSGRGSRGGAGCMLVNRSQLILEAGLGLVRVESLATDTRHNWASHFASPIFFGSEIILTRFVYV